MDTSALIHQVKQVNLNEIKPNPDNPRGEIDKNESFGRLVSSINDVGILVPLVIRSITESGAKYHYEIVDGERRYLAARELNLEKVPAHILPQNFAKNSSGALRKLMFHLHMTREQWGAMAQCRSLVEAYPTLNRGIPFSEKRIWCDRLAKETGMAPVTARDRIHVLSWPRELKDKFFSFDDTHPKQNIYSYVLAIEASIVELSVTAFPHYYNGGKPADVKANLVRGHLLDKTISGIETGLVTSREQIRSVSPLFEERLTVSQKKEAIHLFKDLVERPGVYFDDIRAEIGTHLPELVQEKPPKPRRVIASIYSLSRTLDQYKAEYVEGTSKTQTKKDKEEFITALDHLRHTASKLKSSFQI